MDGPAFPCPGVGGLMAPALSAGDPGPVTGSPGTGVVPSSSAAGAGGGVAVSGYPTPSEEVWPAGASGRFSCVSHAVFCIAERSSPEGPWLFRATSEWGRGISGASNRRTVGFIPRDFTGAACFPAAQVPGGRIRCSRSVSVPSDRIPRPGLHRAAGKISNQWFLSPQGRPGR